MLLLMMILVSGCLASCAAQTSSLDTSTTADPPTTPSIQATAVLPTSDVRNNPVAILQTAVRSSRELNETVGPVLNKLYDIIHQLQPHLNFTLTVRNVTGV
ncbi:hypothetical protein JOB18_047466 [Solea senegalensis]|uniref:Uncharacterized protein n=1 Tax=Solea senegalensis TaxID=28829 RepID=A0AAV6TBQ5_SOLSE|nr:hypothetical protein JOB18_047466 [Solea senegalensis]